jgi:hypothetical protein
MRGGIEGERLLAYRRIEDPYPGYHRLRTEAPFFREPRRRNSTLRGLQALPVRLR